MTTYVADGTILGRGDGASPEVFTNVPQLQRIGSVGQSRGLIDVTNLASTAREYKKAIKDGEEIACLAQYDPDDTVHAGLRADKDAETARNFRVTLVDSPPQTITFAALVTVWRIVNIEIDQVLGLEFTLKPTGDLTFA